MFLRSLVAAILVATGLATGGAQARVPSDPLAANWTYDAVSLPAAARESFLEGTWDATGMLLDRYEDVEAVANRLPYVTGWR